MVDEEARPGRADHSLERLLADRKKYQNNLVAMDQKLESGDTTEYYYNMYKNMYEESIESVETELARRKAKEEPQPQFELDLTDVTEIEPEIPVVEMHQTSSKESENFSEFDKFRLLEITTAIIMKPIYYDILRVISSNPNTLPTDLYDILDSTLDSSNRNTNQGHVSDMRDWGLLCCAHGNEKQRVTWRETPISKPSHRLWLSRIGEAILNNRVTPIVSSNNYIVLSNKLRKYNMRTKEERRGEKPTKKRGKK